jgi:hypothetical protein
MPVLRKLTAAAAAAAVVSNMEVVVKRVLCLKDTILYMPVFHKLMAEQQQMSRT